jgi:hypothetical protein
MKRVVLLGMIALGCACHGRDRSGSDTTNWANGAASGSESAALVGNAAGTVREMSGVVTVAGKPLSVGDHLAAGDVVTTGDHSRVVIELTHNGAKWELGPNRAVRVADSIAWKVTRDETANGLVVRDMAQPNVTPGAASGGDAPAGTPVTPKGAAAVLMIHRAALMHCLDAKTVWAQLQVHVDAKGQATTEVPDAPDSVRACIVAEVAKLSFPAVESGVGITLEK